MGGGAGECQIGQELPDHRHEGEPVPGASRRSIPVVAGRARGTRACQRRMRSMRGSKSGSAATVAGTFSPKYSMWTAVPGTAVAAGSQA
ncbi:hypothetical protein SMALB_1344 [Streptomyces malaysiensis]|uniref:Uncharacterized protein n=1 Tax=Streptomyces malaysiensis TaxID=92644 RepID=A0A7X6AV09_STRMQ|nr:hypothetical protein [Streptomyces malaysiensis]